MGLRFGINMAATLSRACVLKQLSRCQRCGMPPVTRAAASKHGLFQNRMLLLYNRTPVQYALYSTEQPTRPKAEIPGLQQEYEIINKKTAEGDGAEPPGRPPTPLKKRLIIVSALVAAWGGTYLAAQYMKDKEKVEKRDAEISQVDIGARDYELVDHNGKRRTKEDFMGQWLLLYFGFTHCPDICPEELEKMAEIIDLVDGDKSIPDLTPIFISVDPERDTPEVIRKYVAEFHHKFIGLTGTKEQVKDAAKTFRVYFSAGPRDQDNDYVVDHTIVMYLMSPKGMFVDYYGSRGTPNSEIVESIRKNMKNYARLHGS